MLHLRLLGFALNYISTYGCRHIQAGHLLYCAEADVGRTEGLPCPGPAQSLKLM